MSTVAHATVQWHETVSTPSTQGSRLDTKSCFRARTAAPWTCTVPHAQQSQPEHTLPQKSEGWFHLYCKSSAQVMPSCNCRRKRLSPDCPWRRGTSELPLPTYPTYSVCLAFVFHHYVLHDQILNLQASLSAKALH